MLKIKFRLQKIILNIISQTSSTEKVESLNKQFERLTSPSGMGGLIKCIYISYMSSSITSKLFPDINYNY